jgi:hypothetical protein
MPRILQEIRAEIESIERDSWSSVARRLTRLGFYEFEDYD